MLSVHFIKKAKLSVIKIVWENTFDIDAIDNRFDFFRVCLELPRQHLVDLTIRYIFDLRWVWVGTHILKWQKVKFSVLFWQCLCAGSYRKANRLTVYTSFQAFCWRNDSSWAGASWIRICSFESGISLWSFNSTNWALRPTSELTRKAFRHSLYSSEKELQYLK